MFFFRLQNNFKGFTRLLHILYLVVAYLVVDKMSKNRLFREFVPSRYKRRNTVMSSHERLRMLIENLGPTYVKFGQILADRPDLVSENIREELKKLHSTVKPFDSGIAFALIEKELGGPISEHFSHINPVCVGSASIGQVYKAMLKNGSPVVIKIQRPDITKKILIDIQVLKYLASLIRQEFQTLKSVDLSAMVEEFGEALIKELNYFNESANTLRFAEIFRDSAICKIPKVYTRYTTRKLLVIEFIDGVVIRSRTQLIAQGIKPQKVAENGLRAFMKMILQHGFFHADPHAGNIMAMNNNSIALIDFGMVGTLKPKQINNMVALMMGLSQKDARKVADALVSMSGSRPFREIDDLQFCLQNVMDKYQCLDSAHIKMSEVANECLQLLAKFRIEVPSDIFLLIKTLATMEKLGYELDPEMPMIEYIKPYARETILKNLTLKNLANEGFYLLKDYVEVIRNLPRDVTEILHNVKNGRLIHDIQIGNEDKLYGAFKNTGKLLSASFITGFVLTGSSLLIALNKESFLVNTLFIASSINAVLLMFRSHSYVKEKTT